MLLITPYPRLVSPLLATKSTPESSSSRRARASSSSSSSSSSYHWPFLTPKRRLNGFKLKSATVPGDVESGSLVKGLKLGGMFGVWYLLNIYYNIFNKQVLRVFPYPATVTAFQLGCGTLMISIMWLLKLHPRPKVTPSQFPAILQLAAAHTLGNLLTNVSLGRVNVSFTHTIKALEPFFTVLFSVLLLGEWPSLWIVCSLLPIVAGVSLASFTEASFNWIGFCSAMASNVTNQSRNVLSKKFMVEKEALDNINLFSIITIISFVLLVPVAILIDGFKFTPSQLHLATSQGLTVKEFCLMSLLAGVCLHSYQQVSYMILEMVSPVTHSVGNCVKRVVVIASSILFFKTPVSPLNSIGTATALAGVYLYTRAKRYLLCRKLFDLLAMAATAPSAVRYAPEDHSLPKPWKGLVDDRTGYLYFWNPETNVTQYERPQPPSNLPVSSSASVQVPQASAVPNGSSYAPAKGGDDKYSRATTDGGPRRSRFSEIDDRSGAPYLIGAANGLGNSLPPSSAPVSDLSPEAYCRRHEITVSGGQVPAPLMSFETTGFPPELLREVLNAGFSAPTPIQAQSWPIAMQGRDIVAIAKTGSGKTLGYLLPGFMHLQRVRNDSRMGPTILVLSPTRELATQIQDEAVKFGRSSRISCTCLYGGAPKGPQLRDLERGADIVVATPGRLNDILEMRRISLRQVSYLVLDEADRMLDMGFEPQIRKIVKEIPTKRQTLMYTATWPKGVRKIAADLLVNPAQVNIGNVDELVANKSITQHIEVVAPMEKQRRLEQILRSQEPGSKVIIFCSTKRMCDQLTRNLTRQFGAAAIHGDKSQPERDNVLNQFRSGRTPVLVATDVAARGLDVKDIRAVINYDFPNGVEDYVHRIGRTGRAGATGQAFTFFGDQDSKHASDLIKILEGANQRVPPQIRDMAARGGGGMNKFSRWGPSSGGRGGSSGYGGRGGGSGYGGRGSDSGYGGRGGFGSRDSGMGSRSSNGWGRERERSRSPERFNRVPPPSSTGSPPRSFHEAMMKHR
ncbi:unnamed protein product [Brassica rapa subsp. trilocularis]